MRNRKTIWLASGICLIPAALGLLFWSEIPDLLAVSFYPLGSAQRMLYKGTVILLLPSVLCLFTWILAYIEQKINPEHAAWMHRLFIWICPVLSVISVPCLIFRSMGMAFRSTWLLPLLCVLLALGLYRLRLRL